MYKLSDISRFVPIYQEYFDAVKPIAVIYLRKYIMIDVNVDKNATVSNQYIFARFNVLVSIANDIITANHAKAIYQTVLTKNTHKRAKIAAQMALVE